MLTIVKRMCLHYDTYFFKFIHKCIEKKSSMKYIQILRALLLGIVILGKFFPLWPLHIFQMLSSHHQGKSQ